MFPALDIVFPPYYIATIAAVFHAEPGRYVPIEDQTHSVPRAAAILPVDSDRPAKAPYSLRTYFARAGWAVVQATLWRLAWKRISFLRPLILRCFGARTALGVLVSEGVRVHFPWRLTLGKDDAIGPGVIFYNLGDIRIGSRVVISQDVYLCGGTHDYTRASYPLLRLPIVIEDDVWICAGAFIGPGVRVGRGAVVGARAVVTKDVPAWKVVAGNPARVIKDRILHGRSPAAVVSADAK